MLGWATLQLPWAELHREIPQFKLFRVPSSIQESSCGIRPAQSQQSCLSPPNAAFIKLGTDAEAHRPRNTAIVHSVTLSTHSGVCVCTCQCPWRAAQNRGGTPLRLVLDTAAPCSSSSSHTASFPRPAAAVRAKGEEQKRELAAALRHTYTHHWPDSETRQFLCSDSSVHMVL